MDTGTDVLFSESSDVLLPSATEVARKFAWAFNRGIDGIAQRIRLGRFARFYYDPQYTAACKFVHDYVDEIVAKAVYRAKEWHAEKKDKPVPPDDAEEERYTFLNALAREGVEPKQIRDQILNICKCHNRFLAIRVEPADNSPSILSGCCPRYIRLPHECGGI